MSVSHLQQQVNSAIYQECSEHSINQISTDVIEILDRAQQKLASQPPTYDSLRASIATLSSAAD